MIIWTRLAFATLALTIAWPVQAETTAQRGAYLAAIMDCTGCHTPGVFMGKPDMGRFLGGGDVGFEIPGLGIFYPPNLTPDAETGLGRWSTEAIVAAIRQGVRPDGRQLAPVMPYFSYAKLTDADARALVTYLKSLPPVRHATPAPVGPQETAKAPYLSVIVPK